MTSPEWNKANPEKMRVYRAKWRAANPEYGADWRAANIERHRVSNTRWRERNPEQNRISATAYARRTRGIPEPTRPKPKLCEVLSCRRPASHADHDHATGVFRGWLCAPHNLGLGAIGDTLEAARALVEYLERV